ncbi:glycoside hydrolase [Pseudodesulfovibrio sp.]|nr:glycoside hydrolase [Pseudodesulfovibrio sp.]
MSTLTDKANRHTIIDRRDGEYICFPDVVRAADGTLIVAYNEQDKHIQPKRRVVLTKVSRDDGTTWSDIVRMDSARSHCPRLTLLDDGEIILADASRVFFHSTDNGTTWQTSPVSGISHDMLDRVLHLGGDSFLTTGHSHVGEEYSAIGQALTEQMVYRSDDHCRTWQPLGAIAAERNLVLCEASMTRLADGRIIALLRENSFIYEPMYLCISEDEGKSWSAPLPTPLIGHRPTMGLIDDGRLLVTYRNVAPDMGTAAWVGSLDELTTDFAVHGRHEKPDNPMLTPDGLHVKNESGIGSVVRYALRPMTDPRTATAVLEAELRVDEADENGCGLRLGVWWHITPEDITPEVEDVDPIPLEKGFNVLRLEYARGKVTLFVNGELKTAISVDDDHAFTRPILFGAPYPFENNAVDCIWKRVSLTVDEPSLNRKYEWNWKAEDGLPDQWAQDTILELKNDRYAASPDFGYSGWTQLADGSFYCVYHQGGGQEEGYEPLMSAHVMGTRFSLDDFK